MTTLASQPDAAPRSPADTPHPAPAAIRAAGLTKRLDERAVLDRLDFTVAPGEFVALLGANGAGKSTLLRLLATLTPPTAGRLELFGRATRDDSAASRARIGMIGHQLMLYRDLSPRENLRFFGRLYRVQDPLARAAELLEFVGLADRADDPVKSLSRGMAQRIAIARALMHDPDLLLADEPFTGLDAISARRLEDCLAELHARDRTILLTTHDIHQALRLARRVLVLRRGRLVMDHPAADLDPALVARAMGGAP